MVTRGFVYRSLTVAGLCAALVQALQPPVIHVDAREVVVDVTVTDGNGTAVENLTKEDFRITDEGKPREIIGFSVHSEYPEMSAVPATSPLHLPPKPGANGDAPKPAHSTAIILDEVNSFADSAIPARQSIVTLMKKIPPDEGIALYVLARNLGLNLLHDYSTDREAILKSLRGYTPRALQPEPPVDDIAAMLKAPAGEVFAAGVDQPFPPGLIFSRIVPPTPAEMAQKWRDNSRDARLSLQALSEQLGATPGRKSIFWVTNAFNPWILSVGKEPPSASPIHGINLERPAWDKTLAAMNEANVAVNVVDSGGLRLGANPALGTIAAMQEIAERTGGKAYFNRNDIDGAIAEGIAASRTIYTLRFRLPDEERDKTFHELNVKASRPALHLFYRQGYYAGGVEKPVDLIAGKIAGKDLEERAGRAGESATQLAPSMQLSWAYAAPNRARVHLAAEVVPAGMKFVKSNAGLHGQMEIVGVALRPDGSEAARFADTVGIDMQDQSQADGFVSAPWRYHHQFAMAPGTYLFRLQMGAGPGAAGKKEAPLSIDRWGGTSFAMGEITLSTETRAPDPGATGALVASGQEFIPAATNRFRPSDHVYVYSEIYDPDTGAGVFPTIRYRIVARATGEVKTETRATSAAGFVRPGSTTVPLALVVPLGQLEPGSWRMEITAGHSSGSESVTRAIDFELGQ